jgi:putative flippase GtrA
MTRILAQLPEGARFLIAGAFNTGLTWLVYLLFLTQIRYQIAYAMAYCLGIATSYLINSRFVFRQPMRWRSALAFPLVYAMQLILGSILLVVLVKVLNVPVQFAPLVVVVLTLPLTFVLSRRIVAGRRNAIRCASRPNSPDA